MYTTLHMKETTIRVPVNLRDNIKAAALARAKYIGINKLSMVDYLRLLIAEQPKDLSTGIQKSI